MKYRKPITSLNNAVKNVIFLVNKPFVPKSGIVNVYAGANVTACVRINM